MDILAFPAEKFINVVFMLVLITVSFSILYIVNLHKYGGLDYAGMTYDFFKLMFYGVLAWLTLYFNFDQETKVISFTLEYKNLSLGEMLVIILAIFEMISNFISILNRISNISLTSEMNNQKHLNKLEEERKFKEMLDEINRAKEVRKIEKKTELELIRIEKLNKLKKKKYRYI